MIRMPIVLAVILVCSMFPALAQGGAPAQAPVPPGGGQADPALAKGGKDKGGEMLMLMLLANPDADMAQMLPLLMMAGGGDVDGDALGLILLMKAMGGRGPQAEVIRAGDTVFVVRRGVLYKVNAATMQIEGTVNYREAAKPGAEEFKAKFEAAIAANDKKLIMELMMDPNADIGAVLPLLLGAAQGAGGQDPGEAAGIMMFTKLLGNAGGGQAVCLLEGDTMLIAEGKALYKINVATMEVEGQVECAQPGGGQEELMKLLGGAMGQAKGAAMRAACMSNLKQLGVAAHMYAQDNNGTLPDATWADDLQKYLKNKQVLACPARPGVAVGYAINEAVAGVALADIAKPAETVLLFETELGEGGILATAEDVPEDGIHEGSIGVVFADGHVEMMTPNRAKALLGGE